MAEVHQLILLHGVDEARRQAVTKHERQVVEAAYQVLSDDAERMGFQSRIHANSLQGLPLAIVSVFKALARERR